ncbi:C-type lectin domain family 4 member E-like [Clupea harengus]|uniref:C-type lectin domain family 4 member E-like n=1 Tax=Clupea harengus TaxID=7950 RepID=A0A6P8FQM1_CLUHA|nr:C-type lectin domain family 4 member E-like [Clupea harengus]XP_031425841.1 C-type lectin domain family 4 member E-like [Clupea harengus]
MEMGIDSNVEEHFPQEPPIDTGNKTTQADAGLNQQAVYRTVGVCFGLLCLLQVTLNITLRLHFLRLANDGQECQMRYNSSIEERDLLMTNYTNVVEERDRLDKWLDELIGWKSFQSSRYFFSIAEKTWNEAREDCKQKGADLVIINSQEEQIFISAHASETWIGLTDSEIEGRWKWVDGTPHSLKKGLWMAGEPNDDKKGEDCGKTYGREWNDQECSLYFRWTCEKNFNKGRT